jgi:hypothetical protein
VAWADSAHGVSKSAHGAVRLARGADGWTAAWDNRLMAWAASPVARADCSVAWSGWLVVWADLLTPRASRPVAWAEVARVTGGAFRGVDSAVCGLVEPDGDAGRFDLQAGEGGSVAFESADV